MTIDEIETTDNIYVKLQAARESLYAIDFKKSGWNDYSKYKYFELKDFMPAINKIMIEKKLFGYVLFDKEMATLTIINLDDIQDKLIFTSPMATASLKACHDVQNLGAVQTYLRRYLYTNAFEIMESCSLDGGGEGAQTPPANAQIPNTSPPSPPVTPVAAPAATPTVVYGYTDVTVEKPVCPFCGKLMYVTKKPDEKTGDFYLYCSGTFNKDTPKCRYTCSSNGNARSDVNGKFL